MRWFYSSNNLALYNFTYRRACIRGRPFMLIVEHKVHHRAQRDWHFDFGRDRDLVKTLGSIRDRDWKSIRDFFGGLDFFLYSLRVNILYRE
jgi:hypothetical protein